MTKSQILVYTNAMIRTCNERIEKINQDISNCKREKQILQYNILKEMSEKQLDYYLSIKKILTNRNKKKKENKK